MVTVKTGIEIIINNIIRERILHPSLTPPGWEKDPTMFESSWHGVRMYPTSLHEPVSTANVLTASRHHFLSKRRQAGRQEKHWTYCRRLLSKNLGLQSHEERWPGPGENCDVRWLFCVWGGPFHAASLRRPVSHSRPKVSSHRPASAASMLLRNEHIMQIVRRFPRSSRINGRIYIYIPDYYTYMSLSIHNGPADWSWNCIIYGVNAPRLESEENWSDSGRVSTRHPWICHFGVDTQILFFLSHNWALN